MFNGGGSFGPSPIMPAIQRVVVSGDGGLNGLPMPFHPVPIRQVVTPPRVMIAAQRGPGILMNLAEVDNDTAE